MLKEEILFKLKKGQNVYLRCDAYKCALCYTPKLQNRVLLKNIDEKQEKEEDANNSLIQDITKWSYEITEKEYQTYQIPKPFEVRCHDVGDPVDYDYSLGFFATEKEAKDFINRENNDPSCPSLYEWKFIVHHKK